MSQSTIDELRYLGSVWRDVQIQHGFFGNQTRAFTLISMEDGPLAKPTINLEDYGILPSEGCFWIKDYDSHGELGQALVAAGVIWPTGRVTTFGPYDSVAREFAFTASYQPAPQEGA